MNRYDDIPKNLGFKYGKQTLHLKQAKYIDGSAAIVIEDEQGQPYAKLSVNVPGVILGRNEYVIKNYSENEDISKAVYKQGWFKDTNARVKSGFVEMPIWRWTRA